MPGFASLDDVAVEEMIRWMLEHEILWDDNGVLGIGARGEQEYGWRHYMEVMSVFLTPPLFQVLHGRRELGLVDRSSFLSKSKNRPVVLSLGGRAWLVRSIDWPRQIA